MRRLSVSRPCPMRKAFSGEGGRAEPRGDGLAHVRDPRAPAVAPEHAREALARGVDQVREQCAGALRVEPAVVDDDTAEDRPLSGEELARGVHDDRRAVLEGPQQVRRREGVVDEEGDAALGPDGGDRGDVEHVVAGVRDRLGEQGARVRAQGGAPRVGVGDVVDEVCGDAQTREVVQQQAPRALVDVVGADDVVAGAHESQDRDRDRGLPARHQKRLGAALERCEPALDGVDGGIAGARVAEAVAAAEVGGGVVEPVEEEPCREVDRQRPRPRRRGIRPDMHLSRGEAVLVRHPDPFSPPDDGPASHAGAPLPVECDAVLRGACAGGARAGGILTAMRIARLLLSGRDGS